MRIEGADPAPSPGHRLTGGAASGVAVAAALPDDLRPRVETLALAPGGDVELRLASPASTIVIGQPDELPAKMVALSTILGRVDLRELAMIDVRVPVTVVHSDPPGPFVAILDRDACSVYDVRTGRRTGVIKQPLQGARVQLHPDGTYLAATFGQITSTIAGSERSMRVGFRLMF